MEISKIDYFLKITKVITSSRSNSSSCGNGYGNGCGNGYGNGNGYGYGSGSGSGYGYGNGSGSGSGYGPGSGCGSGYGNGHGDGYGDGDNDGQILSFNKQKVYIIDDTKTIITSVKNDVAKGFILNKDLTLTDCYIVKNNYHFSHGKTLKEALQSLENKTLLSLPIEQRIENFKNSFKNYNLKQKASLLYDWHYKLTGSCRMGRDNFVLNKNINLAKDKLTIHEFIKLTENSYGGEIIKQL